jgi:hypothetical protein
MVTPLLPLGEVVSNSYFTCVNTPWKVRVVPLNNNTPLHRPEQTIQSAKRDLNAAYEPFCNLPTTLQVSITRNLASTSAALQHSEQRDEKIKITGIVVHAAHPSSFSTGFGGSHDISDVGGPLFDANKHQRLQSSQRAQIAASVNLTRDALLFLSKKNTEVRIDRTFPLIPLDTRPLQTIQSATPTSEAYQILANVSWLSYFVCGDVSAELRAKHQIRGEYAMYVLESATKKSDSWSEFEITTMLPSAFRYNVNDSRKFSEHITELVRWRDTHVKNKTLRDQRKIVADLLRAIMVLYTSTCKQKPAKGNDTDLLLCVSVMVRQKHAALRGVYFDTVMHHLFPTLEYLCSSIKQDVEEHSFTIVSFPCISEVTCLAAASVLAHEAVQPTSTVLEQLCRHAPTPDTAELLVYFDQAYTSRRWAWAWELERATIDMTNENTQDLHKTLHKLRAEAGLQCGPSRTAVDAPVSSNRNGASVQPVAPDGITTARQKSWWDQLCLEQISEMVQGGSVATEDLLVRELVEMGAAATQSLTDFIQEVSLEDDSEDSTTERQNNFHDEMILKSTEAYVPSRTSIAAAIQERLGWIRQIIPASPWKHQDINSLRLFQVS